MTCTTSQPNNAYRGKSFSPLAVLSIHWTHFQIWVFFNTYIREFFWCIYASHVFLVLFFYSLDHEHQGTSKNCGNRTPKDELKSKVMLQDLEPCASQSLNELISLVHDRLNPSNLTGSTDYSLAGENDDNKRKEDSCSSDDDSVANLILTLHPLKIHRVFLAMAVSLFLTIFLMSCGYLGPNISVLSFISFLSVRLYLCFLSIF